MENPETVIIFNGLLSQFLLLLMNAIKLNYKKCQEENKFIINKAHH